jgi:hypothetical protein
MTNDEHLNRQCKWSLIICALLLLGVAALEWFK